MFPLMQERSKDNQLYEPEYLVAHFSLPFCCNTDTPLKIRWAGMAEGRDSREAPTNLSTLKWSRHRTQAKKKKNLANPGQLPASVGLWEPRGQRPLLVMNPPVSLKCFLCIGECGNVGFRVISASGGMVCCPLPLKQDAFNYLPSSFKVEKALNIFL